MSSLFKSFVKNPNRVHYDGEDPDEGIIYLFRKSFFVNLGWMFISAIMVIIPSVTSWFYSEDFLTSIGISSNLVRVSLIFWYLCIFGYILHNGLSWFFNIYIVTTKKIVDIDFRGLTYKNISEAPIRNIEDVTSNISGFLGTIFNYGSVEIQTSAEKREFEFESVSNPSKIRDIIADLVEGEKNGH